MISTHRAFILAPKSVKVPLSAKCNISSSQIRYSSSSSPSNLTQPQDSKGLERDSEETAQSNISTTTTSTSASDKFKTPISLFENSNINTTSNNTSTSKCTITNHLKKMRLSSKAKVFQPSKAQNFTEPYRTQPVEYNIPSVPSIHHIKWESINEDAFFNGFRPLLVPLKYSQPKPIRKSAISPKNDIAYWNTSIFGEPFVPLDCIPKFMGDGMKAFKIPPPPGSEIRIYPREENSDRANSTKMKMFFEK